MRGGQCVNCGCIASNQMLLNFGRAKSPGKSGHEIGDGSPAPSGRSAATLGEPDLGTYVPRLIDTADGTHKSSYVNHSVRGWCRPAPLRKSSTVVGQRPITRFVGKAALVASETEWIPLQRGDGYRQFVRYCWWAIG